MAADGKRLGRSGIAGARRSGLLTAFQESERRLKRFVARFFARPEDVEDVVQEAFARAWNAKGEDELRSPKAFLFRVARNIALNRVTRGTARVTDYLEECLADEAQSNEPPLDQQIAAQQELAEFCRAVAALPPQCRRVFLMRKVYGHSPSAIARSLGLSVSTVEKHIAAGLLRCGAAMRAAEQPRPAATSEAGHPVRGGRRHE